MEKIKCDFVNPTVALYCKLSAIHELCIKASPQVMESKNLDIINTILGGYCTILLHLSAAFLLTTRAFFFK